MKLDGRIIGKVVRAAVDNWSPGVVNPLPSTRSHGLLRGGIATFLGQREAATGAALTQVQIDTFAPFLASHFKLAPEQVLADLQQVRVQVGGLAHGNGNWATTVGHNIYVSDADFATRMLSWNHRKWLAHELAHTMQWRRLGDQLGVATDVARDRAFLAQYVGGFVQHDGLVSKGGLAQAIEEAIRRVRTGEPKLGFGTLLHDTHPMEREADAAMKAIFG